MPHNRHGSVQILQCFVQFELLHVADTLFHVGLRVPKFNPSSDTVEHRGGNGRVALLSKSIRDRPDVAIDAEDLLDHDHRAMWLGRRRRQVGLKFMAITRHYRGEFTHGRYPYGAGEGSKRIASRVVEGKAWGAQRAQVEGCARAHTMEIVDNPLNCSGKPRFREGQCSSAQQSDASPSSVAYEFPSPGRMALTLRPATKTCSPPPSAAWWTASIWLACGSVTWRPAPSSSTHKTTT